MTHIEQAIRDAHENGGYFKGYSIEFMYGRSNGPLREQKVIGVLFDPDGDAKVALTETEIFLQPHFWQALGKARGWGKDILDKQNNCLHCGVNYAYQPSFESGCNHAHYPEACRVCSQQEKDWRDRAGEFWAHIMDGEDAESFFASVLG